MADNMRYYDKVRTVPEDALKAFSNGRFSGTDINPMWRIKKLTELFGPAGIGWYTEVLRQEVVPVNDGNMMVFVDINLYVKEGDTWSKPIFGTGGNTLKLKGRGDDEGYKKAYTDAMSIACKALGIGADVWYANDTTSKYSDKYVDNSEPTSSADMPARGSVEAAQEVGKRKLAEMEAKLKQASQNGDKGKPGVVTCERCGNAITGVVLPDGTTMTGAELVGKSKLTYNGVYCFACMQALNKAKKKGT